jgi:WD40 repeat protein
MSADEKQICAGSSEGVIMVWVRATGAQVAVLRGHGHEISFVAFSPDGTRIVSGSHDSTLRIWDSVSGAIVAILGGHTDSIISVDFSPDGKRFLSWSKDYTVRVWDSENGLMLLGPLQADRKIKIEGFGFSPDDKLIISWKGLEIYHVVRQIWDSRTGVAINHRTDEHIEPVTAVAWSPNGKQILTASQDKTVCVWDSDTGDLVAGPFVEHASVTCVIFSPDNTYIISCATPGFGDHINVNTIRAWKVCGCVNLLVCSHPSQIENSGLWGNHPRFYDGWIINSAGEHIIWVPP